MVWSILTFVVRSSQFRYFMVLSICPLLSRCSPAHINAQFAFLLELFKFIGMHNVAGIFRHKDNAILVKGQFLQHPAHITEAMLQTRTKSITV